MLKCRRPKQRLKLLRKHQRPRLRRPPLQRLQLVMLPKQRPPLLVSLPHSLLQPPQLLLRLKLSPLQLCLRRNDNGQRD